MRIETLALVFIAFCVSDCLHLQQNAVGERTSVNESVAMCGGKEAIYIQWRSPVSGWYDFDRMSEGFHRKSRVGGSYFEFLRRFTRRSSHWIIRQWTDGYEINNLKIILYKYKNPIGIGLKNSLFPPLTNLVKELNEVKESSTPSTTSTTSATTFHPNIDSSSFSNSTRASISKKHSVAYKEKDLFVPTFKVFCPGKCLCSNASAPQLKKEFLPLEALSHDAISRCKESFYLVGANSEDPSKGNLHWRPQSFLSDDCSLLYFNENYQLWSIHVHTDSSIYSEYISSDSGPCLELLPEGKSQSWSLFSVWLKDEKLEYTETEMEDFQVVCNHLGDASPPAI